MLKDEQLAEDAVHNTFMELIRKKELLELPNDDLKALLIVIVKRRSIDILRKRARDNADNLDYIRSIPSPDEPVEIQITTSEDYRRLTDLISCLNESHRSILQLKYFAELSNTKIGEYLGITSRQVATQLYKAKLRLRKSFFDSDSDEVDEDMVETK